MKFNLKTPEYLKTAYNIEIKLYKTYLIKNDYKKSLDTNI